MNICYDCLEFYEKLVFDKGNMICNGCYHKRYSKKKCVNNNQTIINNPTIYDLKRRWEKG